MYAPEQFAPHGISVEDWTRFLQDLGLIARLSARGVSLRGSTQPLRVGFVRGRAGAAYEAVFAKTPVEEVQDLIAVWNESALERRKIRVSLHTRVDAGGPRREGYDLLVEAL